MMIIIMTVIVTVIMISNSRSPSAGASISYTMHWSQPFPSRFIYRTALRGGFALTQFKNPIKTELDRMYCFTSHSPMRHARN